MFESISDLFRSISDLFKSISDLFESISHLFRSISDLFKSISDLFKSISDLFKSISGLFRSISDLSWRADVIFFVSELNESLSQSNYSNMVVTDPFTMITFFGLKRDKLRWEGSLNDLKKLVNIDLEETGHWRSPGRGMWSFTSEQLSITWYKNSKNINLFGVRGPTIYELISQYLKEEETVMGQFSNNEVQMGKSPDDSSSCNCKEVNLVDDGKTFNCECCRKLSIDMDEVKLDLAICCGPP